MDDEFVHRSTLVFSQDPVDLVLLELLEGRRFWPDGNHHLLAAVEKGMVLPCLKSPSKSQARAS